MAPQLGDEIVGEVATDLGDGGGEGDRRPLVREEARTCGVVPDGEQLGGIEARALGSGATDVEAPGAAVDRGDELPHE